MSGQTLRLAVAFSVVSLLGLAVPHVDAQETTPTVQENSVRVVVEEAIPVAAALDKFRRERDVQTPTLMYLASNLAAQGRSKDEITAAVVGARNELDAQERTGLLGDWKVSGDYVNALKLALGTVNTAVAKRYGADSSFAVDPLVELGVSGFEELVKPGKIETAARAIGDTNRMLLHADQELVESTFALYQTHDVLRQVYDEQFLGALGFRPSDPVEEILEQSPEFAEYEVTKTVLSLLKSDGGVSVRLVEGQMDDLLSAWTSTQASINESNAQILTVIAAGNSRQETLLTTLVLSEDERREAERRAEIGKIKAAGLRSGVYLTSTLAGLIDPDLGRQVDAVGSAALSINESLQAFETASKLGDGATQFGSLALTGNVVGAVFSVISAFGDQGSADEAILQEIAALRRQVEQVRREMHDRFDRVDQKLDAIYKGMVTGFFDLEVELSKQRRSLDLILDQLALQAESILGTQGLLLDEGDRIVGYLATFQLEDCLRRQQIAPATPLDDQTYLACVAKLSSYAIELPEADQLRKSLTNPLPDRIAVLEQTNGRNAAYLQTEFVARRGDTSPQATLIDPGRWLIAAQLYRAFLGDWPQQRRLVEDDRMGEVRAVGMRAVRFYDLVRAEFEELGGSAERQNSVDFTLDQLERIADELARIIHQ